jgi:hypothetical protein
LKKKFIHVDKAKLVNDYKECYGVLTIPDQQKQTIKIHVSDLGTNYFEAYPIHESQQIKKNPNGYSEISFELIPTIELTRLFLSQGKHVKIVEPLWFIGFTEKLK